MRKEIRSQVYSDFFDLRNTVVALDGTVGRKRRRLERKARKLGEGIATSDQGAQRVINFQVILERTGLNNLFRPRPEIADAIERYITLGRDNVKEQEQSPRFRFWQRR